MLNSAGSRKSSLSAGSFDAGKINATIQRAFAAAGLDSQSGPMKGVTDTIERALSGAGIYPPPASPEVERGVVLDGVARDITPGCDSVESDAGTVRRPVPAPGEFLSRSFSNAAGTRVYRLHVPASYSKAAGPVPAVLMLHGCTQSPEDFAAGTRMNALADEHGFLVIYPAQPAQANPSRCWNWFNAEDQVRGRGEPSLLAGITRAVAADYRVDPQRIFVAGMSAGAAMAVVLGETYPDLFAAVGAHSGLAFGAAHDVSSAMAAMQGGSVLNGNTPPSSRADRAHRDQPMPTIVFHGDRDMTVNVRNGNTIVEHAKAGSFGDGALRAKVEGSISDGGRTCRRTTYVDAAERAIVEHWVLTGAGHAWSGGNPAGSYTDARGPDASAEMVRFFLAQQRPSAASADGIGNEQCP